MSWMSNLATKAQKTTTCWNQRTTKYQTIT